MNGRISAARLLALAVAIVFAAGSVGDGRSAHAAGRVVAVDPGGTHTCALTDTGILSCWGWNFHGQLGDGTFESRLEPAVVDLPDVSAFATGANHTCAIADGDLWCWGLNEAGQLGDGSFETRTTPAMIAEGYVSVAAGGSHTCAVTSEGAADCWGENGSGQLGNGTTEDSYSPVPACSADPCEPLENVTMLALGAAHTCAVAEAELFCWGDNTSGQLGDGGHCGEACTAPVAICIPDGITCLAPSQLTAGGSHTCATNGSLFCWGDNSHGQLGDGTEDGSALPVPLFEIELPVEIAAGLNHTCALSLDGDVSCWGLNSVSQLGNGTGRSSLFPVAVEGLGVGVADIAAGSSHSCAVLDSGALQCWGWNADGRLGDGTFANRDWPVDVVGFGLKDATPTPVPDAVDGDVDCDGDVDAIDATLVLQFTASLVAELPCEAQADVSGDSVISSIDATVILQRAAGLL